MSEIINGTNNRRNYPHPHDNGLMRYLERGCENDDSNDGELDDASRGHISRIPEPENLDSLTADKGDYTGESTTEDEDEPLSAEEVKELESLRDLDKIYQFLPPGLKGGGGSFSSVDHYSNEMSQAQPHRNYQRMDQYRPPPPRKNYRSASIVADESAVSTNSNNGSGRRNTIIFHHNHQDDPQQSNPTAPPKIAAKKMARGKTPDRELLALKRRLSVIIPANIITQSQHQPSTTVRVTAGGGGKDGLPEIPTIRIVSPNPSSPLGSGSPSSPPSGGGDIPSSALFSSLVSIPEAGETAALPPSEILYLAKQSRGKATASYSPVLLFPSSATTTPYKGSSTADSQSSSCCHHKNSCPENGGYSNIAHQYLPYLPSPNFSPGGGGNLTGGSFKKFNFQRTPSLEKLLSIT